MLRLVLILSVVFLVFAQPTIVYNGSHYTPGNVYTNRTVDDVAFSIGAPGGPRTWDFTAYPDGNETDFEVVEYSASLPEVGECAMTPNYIIYNHTVTDTLEVEGYGYFHQNSSRVISLGLWGEMIADGSTYSLTAFNDVTAPSTTFPMNYGDSWTEITHATGTIDYIFSFDYEVWDTNYYEIDGWGQVVLPMGTFDALRIKKRHHQYQDFASFFFDDKFNREFGWQWVCYEIGLVGSWMGPKDTLGNLPDSTFTVGKLNYQVSNTMLQIAENIIPREKQLRAYPNPFNSAVSFETRPFDEIRIFDLYGNLVLNDVASGGLYRWTPSKEIPSGEYILILGENENRRCTRISFIK